MLKSFLNQNFTTIEDLASIDQVIKRIEGERLWLKEQASPEGKQNQWDLAGSLIQQLETIVDQDDVAAIDELIQKYGKIELLTSAKQELSKKLILKNIKTLYDKYLDLTDKLNDFELLELPRLKIDDAIGHLEELRTEVEAYEKTETDDPSSAASHTEYVDLLQSKFQSVAGGEMKERLTSEFKSLIREWDDEQKIRTKDIASMRRSFGQLVRLQSIYNLGDQIDTFWALDCLASNFKVKFVFHFEGSSETNRLNKPEYALNYLQAYLKKSVPAVEKLFGSTFKQYFPDKSLKKNFIISLLSPVKQKFDREMDSVSKHEGLLSHLILELQKFDQNLSKTYNFTPVEPEYTRLLTSSLILSNEDVFNLWLNNEKNFVNHRYEEIISKKDAFAIDKDFVENGKTKPTRSAINLKSLLEGISDNYAMLPTKFQVKFLSEVQLRLLNLYFANLKQGFNALDTIIHGKINDEVSALGRICRIWCSSKYIIETMATWGESIVFLELWSSINGNSRLDTTFFDSVIKGYNKELMTQLPRKIHAYFERELNKTMKSYFISHSSWATISEMEPGPSRELDVTLAALKNDLTYLRTVVSYSDFLKIQLVLSDAVTSYFEKNVIYCNKFSVGGALQLEADYNEFYQSLGLLRDNAHFGNTQEIISVLKCQSISEVYSLPFRWLKEYQVNELVSRKNL
ncbi:hypothetical protein KL949_000199 [Ogataea haglerorum]|nr:hypothetical protein KL915_004288 [Ogataea haglerorum]KAG7722750.1 hypothetical protein KL913_000570 [Ogataea haglerorum]KAG7723149.1 hypothetical protein KL949_000199 [Ogataea haglerorum]KAG7756078.1 hypothetical protein KL947_004127 [Ogataea haglerorum]KAG7815113.1 hypothetical protein KL924_000199 [Ogataea haglerorum]